ncbi:MAG: hypothetical protein K2Y21_14125 [Phycisphaerales bacterium]|nr:hypothetical protein [Phycisphaerales bacterium]
MVNNEWSADDAFSALKEHRETIKGAAHANESTTRLRAINTLLFNVLKWDTLDVQTEKYVRAEGFADYAFGRSRTISLILEAKRDADYFIVNKRTFPDRPASFSLIARESPSAEAALRQATSYAASLGSHYVAISNGHQWLLSLTYVQNQAIEDRMVFVSESIDAIQTRFHQFFECFSPQAVFANIASTRLLENRKAPAPAKLSTRITNYPTPADRNVISNELGYIVDLVWDEMQKDESSVDFLTECYVPPPASEDALKLASGMLANRKRQDESEMQKSVPAENVADLLPDYTPERPIVVLGRVGHGKTTFLRYLRLVKSPQILDKYLQIDINFLDRPDNAADVSRYIYSEVERQLEDVYGHDIYEDTLVRQALHGDLQKFARTPVGRLHARDSREYKLAELDFLTKLTADTHNYIAKVFRLLRKGRSWSIALFLDNLDRRIDPIQEEAFLRASAMARDWSALVFVCLRPGTFYRSKEQGVLDSVAPRIVSVASPSSAEVLQRRFRYAAQIALGKKARTTATKFTSEVTLQLPNVAAFLSCAADSLDRGTRLVRLFDAVSNGNVRDLLKYVREMITAKHLDTAKIISKIPSDYRIPEHEGLRALLFGDYLHYDPGVSVFINLFDVTRADPQEHFGRLIALSLLCRHSPDSATQGFCKITEIVQSMCDLGYSDTYVRSVIEYLYTRKCCEGRVHGLDWDDDLDEVRVTGLGSYHVNDLVFQFQYFDAVIVDTPILNQSYRERLIDVLEINARLDRCEVFIRYLEGAAASISDPEVISLCKNIFGRARSDIDRVRDRVRAANISRQERRGF